MWGGYTQYRCYVGAHRGQCTLLRLMAAFGSQNKTPRVSCQHQGREAAFQGNDWLWDLIFLLSDLLGSPLANLVKNHHAYIASLACQEQRLAVKVEPVL